MRKVVIGTHDEGLKRLKTTDVDEPQTVGSKEIKVRVHASSLNYHDLSVANGTIPTAQNRVPLSDCSGIITQVGEDVDEFEEGDHVVSTFFPDWLNGEPRCSDFSRTPGDGLDGYATEYVVRPATWFTKAPQGWSHAEAATITTAGY